MNEKYQTKPTEVPSFGNLEFERLADQILQLLPASEVERTAESIQLTTGDFRDESGLVILISSAAVELRLPRLTWDGPHTPVKTTILWQRLCLNELKESQLTELISAAQLTQKQNFYGCKFCGQRNPKVWMHSPDVCDSCAERELGIVH